MIWVVLTIVIFGSFIAYSFLNKKSKKDLIKLQEGYNKNEDRSKREGTYRRGEPVQPRGSTKPVSTEPSDAGDDESKGRELLQTTTDSGDKKDDGSDRESDNKLQGLLKRMKLKE